ncbi:hypothetical protein [Sporosarcina aquimarina]|uniref:Uncharacterized protein n=1 Tax=Sporosarcina aquimarina TaxID=114975 RepID=A0ABU4G0H4_9BACL|nr:hypothetical protein [Sporosarcina aquimarina]MDW0110448.1 hypothetical protein [Sporosarcina aquimarina]
MIELYEQQQRELQTQFADFTAVMTARLLGRELTPLESDYLRGNTNEQRQTDVYGRG